MGSTTGNNLCYRVCAQMHTPTALLCCASWQTMAEFAVVFCVVVPSGELAGIFGTWAQRLKIGTDGGFVGATLPSSALLARSYVTRQRVRSPTQGSCTLGMRCLTSRALQTSLPGTKDPGLVWEVHGLQWCFWFNL